MYYLNNLDVIKKIPEFLRTKFTCIIWTIVPSAKGIKGSWGLSLFVLFEPNSEFLSARFSSWGLSLFVLFELTEKKHSSTTVLEGWIYLYYLNLFGLEDRPNNSSWGLNLFVLFELSIITEHQLVLFYVYFLII